MSQVLLQAHEVSRRYGRRWALRRVSLVATAGSLTAVIGHNGAGKSTLLNLLAGVSPPTEGAVSVLGHDLHDHPDPALVRAKVGFLGHEPFVYPSLTGRENLRFLGALYGHSLRADELTSTLERVGLEHASERQVSTYSRGMVQRLALARIMVQKADVWVLDEPLTGLDTQGQEFFLSVADEAKARGCAIVLVTHQAALYERLADQVLILDGGRIRGEKS